MTEAHLGSNQVLPNKQIPQVRAHHSEAAQVRFSHIKPSGGVRIRTEHTCLVCEARTAGVPPASFFDNPLGAGRPRSDLSTQSRWHWALSPRFPRMLSECRLISPRAPECVSA